MEGVHRLALYKDHRFDGKAKNIQKKNLIKNMNKKLKLKI
jgi:hypothetical protein